MSNQQEQYYFVDTFTAFEAVHLLPVTALAPTLTTAFDTAQDLLDWVRNDPSRTRNQHNNECSAIKWLSKIDDTPLSLIPLDVRYLVDDRIQKIRKLKRLKKRNRSGIVNLLNRVLVRAGILAVGTRRGGITSHAWTTLIKSVPSRDAIQSLSTLGKFCSGRGIEPPDVTLDVWHVFVDETLNHSTFKKPRATLQKTLQASNAARATVPGWPLPEFPKLINPRLVSIPKEDLPTSFYADLDTYVGKSSTPSSDIFDTSGPRQLSSNTLARYREVAIRTASAQVHQGRPPSEICDLAALLDIEWLKQAMRWMHDHAGGTFLRDHLNVAATWVSFADNYVRTSEPALDVLRGIMSMIAERLGPAEFSQRNIQKLEQFSDPKVVDDFILLPFRIMDEIQRKKQITVADATQMMAAVGIEMLLNTMIRRENMTDLDRKQHFWPEKPKPDGSWNVRIEGKDVKNKKALNFKLAKHTTRLIEFYWTKCRPLLAKKQNNLMFLAMDGGPKSYGSMAELVVRVVRKRLDLDVNVHLFRHIGAMLYLDRHPGNLEVVRIMLGHGSAKTTERFYARMKATKVVELFTQAVLGERDAMIDKLKLGWSKAK